MSKEKKSVFFTLLIIVLTLSLVLLVLRIIEINRYYQVENVYTTPATIQTCDRYNICETTKVEGFEILVRGDGLFMTTNRLVRFERDGESIKWNLERSRIEVSNEKQIPY